MRGLSEWTVICRYLFGAVVSGAQLPLERIISDLSTRVLGGDKAANVTSSETGSW